MVRDRARRALAEYRPLELDPNSRRMAGVLLLLHHLDGEDHLVFQQRTERVRHHKGEISFPGGARDPEDRDLLATALRETHEEIGVGPELVEVYGQLDDTETRGSGYLIRPFVGAAATGIELTFTEAEREVRELLHVPVSHLLSEESHTWKVVDADGSPTPTAAYSWEDHVIWGATARVLGQFLALLGNGPEVRE
jgi:8-oxo-dGTP pyrophosphatase MutT (NUDIX family)